MPLNDVAVFCPNGKIEIVKCSPLTTILEIIERVCKKQGLNELEYDIKHHSRVLDISHTFKFAGLPNKAILYLITAKKKREEGDVGLVVYFEDGSRLTDTFNPSDTLLSVLNKVCPENVAPDKNPVVIYTTREIYGQELKTCTLRSLGLLGGRAMIRVLDRDPELLKQQANISVPLPLKPTEEKPFIRKFQPLESVPSKHDYGVGHSMINNNRKPQKNTKSPKENLFQTAREKRKSSENFFEEFEKGKKKLVPTESVNIQSIEEKFVFCGERNGMVFSAKSDFPIPCIDLPDEFFELTIDDGQKIMQDLQRMRFNVENQMFQTSRVRELAKFKMELRQLNMYKKTVIRVQFPDETVVQGSFKPTETVLDVSEFIRSCLEKPDLDFYLYLTPPKVVLSQNSKLFEIDCVPGALMHFGVDTEQWDGEFIKKELKDKFTNRSTASLIAAKIRRDNKREREESDDKEEIYMEISSPVDNSVNYGASTSTGITERKVTSDPANYPKWFKPL